MPVRVAASAGWCFGVKRAMDMAFRAAPACTLGPLIHNSDAVKDLEKAGVRVVDTPCDAPEGSTLVLRSHGVTQEEYLQAQQRCRLVDATCPYVSAIHMMVEKAQKEGVPVIVAGQAAHPEVRGIVSRAGSAYVVADVLQAKELPRMESALLVSQTTLGGEEFGAIAQTLKALIPGLEVRNTVCRATEERQAEARELAADSDIMLVVGDRTSANTRRLYEICRDICPSTYLITGTEDMDGIKIMPGLNIGITAGASTPCRKYEEVFTRMNDIENNVPVQQEANAPQAAPEADFASQVDESLQ
nr:4-hydroxy-3-methylbut-2-enyl diphosphate reductase [Clostridiales bacterium]